MPKIELTNKQRAKLRQEGSEYDSITRGQCQCNQCQDNRANGLKAIHATGTSVRCAVMDPSVKPK